jgi:hypothetical protein
MSEIVQPPTEDDDRWQIEHSSPVVRLNVDNGTEYKLHYGNTSLWLFSGAWACANHVFVQINDDGGLFVFDNQEVLDSLHEQEFPAHHMPWPSEGDLQAYRDHVRKKLDDELNEL